MTASVPLPPRDSMETFLKFNKLTEHLTQSPVQNSALFMNNNYYYPISSWEFCRIMPFKAIQAIFWVTVRLK